MNNLTIKAEDLKKSELVLTYNILVGREVKQKRKSTIFFAVLSFFLVFLLVYELGVHKPEIILKFTLFLLFLSFIGIIYRSLQILIIEDRSFDKIEIFGALKKIEEEQTVFEKKLNSFNSLIKQQNKEDKYYVENPEYLFLEEDSGAFINVWFPTSTELDKKTSIIKKIRNIQNHLLYTIPFEKIGLQIFLKSKGIENNLVTG
jgi:hypothetical protein